MGKKSKSKKVRTISERGYNVQELNSTKNILIDYGNSIGIPPNEINKSLEVVKEIAKIETKKNELMNQGTQTDAVAEKIEKLNVAEEKLLNKLPSGPPPPPPPPPPPGSLVPKQTKLVINKKEVGEAGDSAGKIKSKLQGDIAMEAKIAFEARKKRKEAAEAAKKAAAEEAANKIVLSEAATYEFGKYLFGKVFKRMKKY
jgi:hypothetical protein